MSLGPIKFEPVLKERIWGSDRLGRLFGKDLPADAAIGESWEVCDMAEGVSSVGSGPLPKMSWRTLLERHGREYGFAVDQCTQPFGLLVKLLDADRVLSVQVHPDAAAVSHWPGARLKTECWYVLAAEPGAVIYLGLKDGVDRARLAAASADGTVAELLVQHKVAVGDFFFVPAGLVHALGAGVMVAEIQTPSDTTFRLFDWNRRDAAGNSRPLHVEEALASINYGLGRARVDGGTPPTASVDAGDDPPTAKLGPIITPPTVASPNCVELVRLGAALGEARTLLCCEYFSVVHVGNGHSKKCTARPGVATIMMVLKGRGTIGLVADAAWDTAYGPGDTLLLPAVAELTIDAGADCEYLLACLETGEKG